MDSLQDIYNRHASPDFKIASDKGTVHSYIPVYEALFADLRAKPVRLLEIGIASGHSLLVWEEYFTQGTIYGLDIEPSPAILHDHPRIKTFRGSSTNPLTRDLFGDLRFDVVIDDGCHDGTAQLATLNVFGGCVVPGGIYVVEDAARRRDMTPFETYGRVRVHTNAEPGKYNNNDRLYIIRR
jgi:cephalosporin hydroxylase